MKEKSHGSLPSNLKKKRSLYPEEEELWHRVRKTVTPIEAKRQDLKHWLDNQEAEDPKSVLEKSISPEPIRPKLPEAKVTIRQYPARSYSPPVSQPASQHQTSIIDDKTARRLLRGRLSIDARIDLHGMTQVQAHSILKNFLFDAWHQNARMVLVITGKGRMQEGILKQAVPNWLREPQLAVYVSAFRVSHITHGGEGALYVRLRRRDKAPRDQLR